VIGDEEEKGGGWEGYRYRWVSKVEVSPCVADTPKK
jgi:hypothetical protein